LKRSVIPNTITISESIGAAINQAQDAGSDVATTLAEHFNGYLLGRGTVASVSSETRGGFDFGVVDISGSRPLTVAFQNENMVASSHGEVLATVPDLISAVDDTGTPVTNADITEGMEVSYVGFPANPAFSPVLQRSQRPRSREGVRSDRTSNELVSIGSVNR